MPQDAAGWIVVAAVLALGFVLGRASGLSAARRDVLASVPQTLARAGAKLSPETLAKAQAALAGGQKIKAIRLVREATGLGLKESKEAVDQMASEA
jgi:large subunit ribosomal protein L7/L12